MQPVKRIDDIIDELIRKEGGYVNDPDDSGGETIYGITVAVARAFGYNGLMQNMPLTMARQIYFSEYVIKPGFDKIIGMSARIAAELVDTGVNMGPGVAVKFLQMALNAFNQKGALWPDLKVDGGLGPRTVECLRAYLQHRAKDDGEQVMLIALNALQGARYIELSQLGEQKNESFVYGWLRNRAAVMPA